MTLDDLGKSANMTKMSLRFEGFFVISPPFLCGEQAVCKTLRRTHIYEVKYNALYFTWKLLEISWGGFSFLAIYAEENSCQ